MYIQYSQWPAFSSRDSEEGKAGMHYIIIVKVLSFPFTFFHTWGVWVARLIHEEIAPAQME